MQHTMQAWKVQVFTDSAPVKGSITSTARIYGRSLDFVVYADSQGLAIEEAKYLVRKMGLKPVGSASEPMQ